MVKIFTHKNLTTALGEQKTKDLVNDFKSYKEGKGLPSVFGRDAPYNFTHHRSYLELQHIHYKQKGFSLRLAQFYRTSGYVLVYCPAYFSPTTFLLIAIIKHWNPKKPEAVTGTDKDNNLMPELEKIAEVFREKY